MTRRLPTFTLTLTCFAMFAIACDHSALDEDAPIAPNESAAEAQGDHDALDAPPETPVAESLEEARRTGGLAEEPVDTDPVETEEPPQEDPEDPPEVTPEPTMEVVDTVLALEGAQVIPQTLLHLESEEANCEGQALQFKWSVAQPDGSVSLFLPSSTAPNPTFEANVAGEYSFELLSFGQDGELCTTPRRFLLSVLPTSTLHIELLWHTPGDPDESDEGPEAGADLDLHVTRIWPGVGPTPWFDVPFDCFWFNANPNWGSLDPMVDDDPSLDRDDTDGAGPENLNLNTTEEGAAYGIMVHAWHDHGYGDSLATIRIYVLGELLYEKSGVTLTHNEGWEVGTLNSALEFTPAEDDEGGPLILNDVSTDLFD
ncbi:MAG: hypothetical protein ACPGU1_12035 [Myxococcota bacterium]